MDYEIRLAGPDDFEGVMRVFMEVADDPMVSIASSDEMASRAFTVSQMLDEADDSDFQWRAFVAVVDGDVVGVCDLLRPPLYRTSHVVEIGIGLLKGFRGQGLGKALMRMACDWLRSVDVIKVRLFVQEGNLRAIRMYQRLGFKQVGVYKQEVRHDNGFMDLLIMEKFL
jgi:RimJ/RimL family protein N-acetyltransferase